ncbi:hypothetical protein [Aeromicrobium sp. CTD01-1L150]|uniref:hypothetical protein n=1 Tax=Aeromicrobium sp. CTD01-1L150 TaxID=3341830 RepID=UPI0035BFBE18
MSARAPQHRQPHGTPAGGQYAPLEHADDGIDLILQSEERVAWVGDTPIVPTPEPHEMPLIRGLGEMPRDRRSELDALVARVAEPSDTKDADQGDLEETAYRDELDAEQILDHMPPDRFSPAWEEIRRAVHEPDLGADDLGSAMARALSENDAWRDAKGIPAVDDYTPPAQHRVDGHGPQPTKGEHHPGGHVNVTDVAKNVRQEIKTAKAAGHLPDHLDYRVTTDKFAGGQSLDVTVCGLDDTQVREPKNNNGFTPLTAEARELDSRVQGIADAWNRQDIDSMTDYFNVSYYSHVELESERSRAFREAEAERRKAKRKR